MKRYIPYVCIGQKSHLKLTPECLCLIIMCNRILIYGNLCSSLCPSLHNVCILCRPCQFYRRYARLPADWSPECVDWLVGKLWPLYSAHVACVCICIDAGRRSARQLYPIPANTAVGPAYRGRCVMVCQWWPPCPQLNCIHTSIHGRDPCGVAEVYNSHVR